MALLEIKDLQVHYGRIQALHGISLEVNEGEIVSLIGANGAGKTTTMRAIAGLLNSSSGSIEFDGKDVTKVPGHSRVGLGMSLTPEGRGVFPAMTVLENLDMGAFARKKNQAEYDEDLDRVFSLFPRLKEREKQAGGTMSGGEQQMLAIGRALMQEPKVLLIDELSMGLAPVIVESLLPVIRRVADDRGAAVILVEQHVRLALEVADTAIVLAHGTDVLRGPAAELAADQSKIERAYLGGSETAA